MPKEEPLTGGQVIALTKKYLSGEDVAFVEKALLYAVDCHSGQFRKSGEPYIIHPIQVAGILAKLKLDAVTVACGFLHDVVEDTNATLDDLEREFGHDGPSIRNHRITKPDFRPCSSCSSRSQAPLYLYTLRMISNHSEGTFGRLRYLLGGDRPSQTARQTLSPIGITYPG